VTKLTLLDLDHFPGRLHEKSNAWGVFLIKTLSTTTHGGGGGGIS